MINKLNMKKILVLFFLSLLSFVHNSYSQNVREFVEGKYFKNQQTGRSIKFGFISSLNTSGLTFKDSEGNIANFVNCRIDMSRDEQYMVLTNCMSNVTGGTLGKIVVYKDRLIWNGSDGSLTFYLENQSTFNENNVVTKKYEPSSLIEGGGGLKKDDVIISDLEVKRVIGKSKKIGNLEIAQFDFSKVMNYKDASSACEQLGNGWRLPTQNELNLIYKNKNIIGGFIKVEWIESYWSSTKSLERNEDYWIKDFKGGWGGFDNQAITIKVRAVRTL
jgi:hypothetical protein